MKDFFYIAGLVLFFVSMLVVPILANRQFGKANALRRQRRDTAKLQAALSATPNAAREEMLVSLLATGGDTANDTLDTLVPQTAEETALRAKGRTFNTWSNRILLVALGSILLSLIL